MGLLILRAYTFFCLYYHSYYYFFGKSSSHVPVTPLIFPIFKDIMWLFFVFISLIYIMVEKIKGIKICATNKSYNINAFFIFVFVFLYLIVAISHFSHKEFIEVFQHDIRNIIWYSVIIFLLPCLLRSNKDIKAIFRFLIINAAIISVFGIATKLSGENYLLHSGYRVLSTLGNPNNLAFFLNVIFFIVLSKLFFERKKNKRLVFLAGLYLFCMILTISLTNFLSFLLGLSMLALFVLAKKPKKVSISIFLIGIFIFILFNSGFFGRVLDKYDRMLDKSSVSTSYYGRIQQAEEVLTYFKESKISYIIFGDFSLSKYKRYDSQYWNLFRNDGLLVLILFLLVFFQNIRIGIIKGRSLMKNKEYELGSILIGISVALLTTVLINFNATALINRFPLNFFIYFFMGIVILAETSNQKINV